MPPYVCQTSFETLHSAAAWFIQHNEMRTHRDRIMEIGVVVGCLCLLFLTYAPVDINGPLLQHNDEVTKCMGELLWT